MSNNLNEYNCWDEWDEVDYGDTWDEYDNYTDWDEDDSPDHSDCYGYGVYSECRVEDSYDDADIPPYIPGKQRLLDIATSHFQVDKYIFTYVKFDKSTNVMIVATNQEEAFAKVTPTSAVEEINGEYYVSSAASVTFTEMKRSIDILREKYPAAAEEDIQFISSSKGTRVIYEGVRSFTYANQVICYSMAYAPLGATEYPHEYLKVQDLIEEEAGSGYTIDYNPQTKETFVRSKQGALYYVSVAQDAVYYNDERYVYSSFDVDIQKLCTVSEWIMSHYDVAQADIAVYSDRIIFTEDGGKTYKILVNDLPEYIEYDYDNYIPANANIEAVLDYKDVQGVPTNYYRVIAHIKTMTGLEATQDNNGFIILYGKSFYVPNAVRFNGWIYAERKDVVAALKCSFVDIDDYFRQCGFYYGTDDNGKSYTAFTYKTQTTWLLNKVINIAERIRVNDAQGGNYLNLTTSDANIESAVEAVFGVTAYYLGARAIEAKTIKSYIESALYIRKNRVSISGSYLYINGKSHTISSLQTSFNSNTYYDKTKLLSAVKNLTPTLSITNIETVLNNGENYAYIEGNQARIRFTTSCLEHVAIGVQIGSNTKWFHDTNPKSSMEMTVHLHDAGSCKLIVRGRTTMDPNDEDLKFIAHSKDCEDSRSISVLHSIPNNMVYIIPYAKQQKCTVTNNSSNIIVKYQHKFYSTPETCTYYKSLSSEKAYMRQVAYNESGLYMNKETFRMDMDLDIVTDSHNVRDWYLEKRIWRLWSQGKSASFSSEQTDSNGKKYFNVTMNGITRKIYKEPSDNAFYDQFLREYWSSFETSNQSSAKSIQRAYSCWDEWDEVDYGDTWDEYDNYTDWEEYDDAIAWNESDAPDPSNRTTIRLVNGHIVMPQTVMYALFSNMTNIETYILSHYKISNPSESLKGRLNAMTLYGKNLDIDCITLGKKEDGIQLMAVDDNTAYVNHATVNNIDSGMNTYRNSNLKNVFDSLNKKRQELFHYNSATHTVDFDGFEVDIPTLTLYPINKSNPTQDDYKTALFATEADIKKIDTYRRIVVYGAGYAGVCAAYKAYQYACTTGFENFEIMLINPVPVPELGGIGTVGGQNFWDVRHYIEIGRFPYRGSVANVMPYDGGLIPEKDRYNTKDKAIYLEDLIYDKQKDLGVNIKHQMDIFDVEQDIDGTIKSITICKIYRDLPSGIIKFSDNENDKETISGDVFIDASEDGKLSRITTNATTAGRFDYPTKCLDDNEIGHGIEDAHKGRQPAATLMFKLKGITPSTKLNTNDNAYGVYEWDDNPSGDNKDEPEHEYDHHAWQFTGGDDTFYNRGRFSAEKPSEMYLFNEEFGNKYLLKSLNAAQNGPDSNEWWINGLLIFNVDGCAHERDKGTGFYPNIRNDYENTDEAWINARQFLEDNSERLLKVYRQLPGFENADFVWEKDANDQMHIAVGDILYIRETVHTSQDRDAIGNETENNNYAVTQRHCHYAAHSDEKDNPNNRQSIGFNFYGSDIHPFKKDDYIATKEKETDPNCYICGETSYQKIRKDMKDSNYPLDVNSPTAPAFIPYSALITKYVKNLLIPGYAVSASSFAWSEMRVLPNQCVLGDAAGIAAVTCLLSGRTPFELNDTDENGKYIYIQDMHNIFDRYYIIYKDEDL